MRHRWPAVDAESLAIADSDCLGESQLYGHAQRSAVADSDGAGHGIAHARRSADVDGADG